MERLSPGHLFEDQQFGPSSPLYWVLGAVFLIFLFGALYVYLVADRRFATDRLHRRLAKRYATLVGWFSGLGLACTTFALLTVPFLSKRIWLVIALLGLLGTAAHGAFYARRRYPAARLAHDEHERRQRSLPQPKAAGRKRRGRRR